MHLVGAVMDYRKLIEFGNGSYIVTIPRSWAKQNNLKKGDLITIDEKEHELVIGTKAAVVEQPHSEIVIETSGKSVEMAKAEIVTAYLNCYDTIIIHKKDVDKSIHFLKSVLRNLSGMEIMEHNASKIVAKNVLNPAEISMDNIIRRMDVIVRSMIDDALLCATGHYSPTILEERDWDVNRLYFLGFRVVKNAMMHPSIARGTGKTLWQLHSDRMVSMRLEKIADCQKRVARILMDMKLDRDSLLELQKLTTQFKEDFERTMKDYYQRDGQDALTVQVSMRERMDACNGFLLNVNNRLIAGKQSPKQRCESHTAAARLTENLKAAFSQVKYMARYVACYQ
jgi:phosphate uptake regulator